MSFAVSLWLHVVSAVILLMSLGATVGYLTGGL